MLALCAALLLAILLPACGLTGVPKAKPSDSAVTRDGLLVMGKVNYVIDGRLAAPYGTAGGAPAPSLELVNLDTGKQMDSRRVQADDGTYVWRLSPGHYVIIGIGPDDGEYRGAWPQVAFHVPPVLAPIYLGHLQLLGTRYTETVTRFTPVSVRLVVEGEYRLTQATLTVRFQLERPGMAVPSRFLGGVSSRSL